MKVQSFDSVWDAVEDSPEAAANMKIRARLMTEIKNYIECEGLTQSQAASLMGVTQPRISDLVRGRIDRFSIDTLVNMLITAGRQVEFTVLEPV